MPLPDQTLRDSFSLRQFNEPSDQLKKSLPKIGSTIDFGKINEVTGLQAIRGVVVSTELNDNDKWEVQVRYEEDGIFKNTTVMGFQANPVDFDQFSESELDTQTLPRVGSTLNFGKIDLLTGFEMSKSGKVVSTRQDNNGKWEVCVEYMEDGKIETSKLMAFKPKVIQRMCSNVVINSMNRSCNNQHFSATVIQQVVRKHLLSLSSSGIDLSLSAADVEEAEQAEKEIAGLESRSMLLQLKNTRSKQKISVIEDEIKKLDSEYQLLKLKL